MKLLRKSTKVSNELETFPVKNGIYPQKNNGNRLPPKAELPFKVRNKVWFVPL